MPKQLTIGILSPIASGFYVSGLRGGMQRVADQHGARTILIQTAWLRPTSLDLVPFQHRVAWDHVDGWVVVVNAVSADYMRALREHGKPILSISGSYGADMPVVLADNRDGARQAVLHLIDHGHRRIAFVGFLEQVDLRERFEGYREALAERGLPYDPALCYDVLDNLESGGRIAAARMLQAGRPATAVMAGTDLNAIGIMQAFQEAGFTLPDDLAVCGFDDIALGQSFKPPLTSVRQEFDRIGAQAVELLLPALSGAPLPGGPRYVSTELIPRGSCGCVVHENVLASNLEELLGFTTSMWTLLERIINDNYRISLALLESESGSPTDLSWLRWSTIAQGCLGLWPEQRPDPRGLAIERTYLQGQSGEGEQKGRVGATGADDEAVAPLCPVEQFPPAEFLGRFAQPGYSVSVMPITTSAHEFGFLALTEPSEKLAVGFGWATVEQWAALLGASLERAGLSRDLRERAAALEHSQEQLLRSSASYARFVPREFLEHLEKQRITEVELGDHVQKEMTILFCDIRSFSTLAETLTPEQTFNFLNSYLSRITPPITNNGGFVDKYIGDAIMALFPRSADDAVSAAIEMMAARELYNTHRAMSGYVPIEIGIGIHTGTLMLGTIGYSERMEGTVISDAVNIAARLEGLTKLYESSIIVTEQTLSSLSDPSRYHARFLGKVRVKGKSALIALHEIFDGAPRKIVRERMRTRADFERGLNLYYEGRYAEACVRFDKVLSRSTRDRAAQIYLERAARLMVRGALRIEDIDGLEEE